LFKAIAAVIMRLSGIPWFIREIMCKNRVTIITYHEPSPERMRRHLAYLSKHYNLMPLHTLVEAIHTGDWSGVPPKGLVVTLDDGHATNHRLLDLFREFSVRPTIFLTSGLVNTNRHFWFKEGGPGRATLKQRQNQERLEVLERDKGFRPDREYPDRQVLNCEEIREMSGAAAFGSHSMSHPILTTCSDGESRKEIRDSKEMIESFLDNPCDQFAYPNGDYTHREVEYVRQAGYRSARTIDCGWNDLKSDPYRLKAITVSDRASTSMLCAQVSGVPSYLRFLSKGSIRGHHPTIVMDGGPKRGLG
jgi:peptidoglycan/xylan/chitin deacetylase (PgdA/CDA1 family)